MYLLDKTIFLVFSSLFYDYYFPSYSQYHQRVAKFLPGFDFVYLTENTLNDTIVTFFLVYIGKKGIKLDFWMFNGC